MRLRFENLAGRTIETWALGGVGSCQDQREFKKRGRGRPSLKDKHKPGINYQRYNYLRNCCRELGEELGKTITHEKAVERAINERAPLFSHREEALAESAGS